jgi:hypothetical protein
MRGPFIKMRQGEKKQLKSYKVVALPAVCMEVNHGQEEQETRADIISRDTEFMIR